MAFTLWKPDAVIEQDQVLLHCMYRFWPISTAPLRHFRVRSQGYSSRTSCVLARQFLTHHVRLPRDFAATQHGERTAPPTRSISYSITSSARSWIADCRPCSSSSPKSGLKRFRA